MITFPKAVKTSFDIQLYCSFFLKRKQNDFFFAGEKENKFIFVCPKKKKRWLFTLRQQIDTNLLIKPHQTQNWPRSAIQKLPIMTMFMYPFAAT